MPSYITRLPLPDTAALLPVAIERVDADAAHYWDQTVGPAIRDLRREDAKWKWANLYYGLGLLEKLSSRRVSLFQAFAGNAQGNAVPLATMLLSAGYPFCANKSQPSVFLWFLASAPKELLASLGVPRPDLIGTALVDAAVQHSIACGYDGRLMLHAAAKGTQPRNTGLLKYYRDATRLRRVPQAIRLPSFFRHNDGRYFAVDEKLAEALSRSLDYLRR